MKNHSKSSKRGLASKAARPTAAVPAPPVGHAILATLGLILLALGIIYLSSVLLPQLKMNEDIRNAEMIQTPEGGFTVVHSDWGGFFWLRLALSVVNLALVVYLLYIYVKDYLRFKSSFALGIVVFLFSFLLYALSIVPILRVMPGPRGGLPDVFSFVPLLFSALGLIFFVRLSNQ